MNAYLRAGISIDETRVSALVVLMIVSFGICVWEIFKHGDIPPNLMQLMMTLIAAVAGVNIMSSIMNRIGGNGMYGGNMYGGYGSNMYGGYGTSMYGGYNSGFTGGYNPGIGNTQVPITGAGTTSNVPTI